VAEGQIDPPPPLGASVDTSFVMGMGKVRDDVKILLDIDKVLGSRELGNILDEAARSAT
jgi:purine-binding chemotaxis protein CheW